MMLRRQASSASAGRASITSRTSRSISRATRWWCLPASRARASPRSLSAPCTPRRSGAISNRSRPTRAACSTRCRCPTSTTSSACRRPSRCSSSAARPPPAPRSAASAPCPIRCACCTRAPATIRAGQGMLYAESFSPNTPEGACPGCHGLGRVYEVTEQSMVPDDSLTIRERAVAAWPTAWHGQNLRDILTTLGYDVDTPWRDLPKKDRNWILFTDEQPTVPVYAGFTPAEVKQALKRKEAPSYQGTFTGARKYVLQTFATTESASMKKRVARYMVSSECPPCHGKRLRPESLSVTFAGVDIADISRLPLERLAAILRPHADGSARRNAKDAARHPEKVHRHPAHRRRPGGAPGSAAGAGPGLPGAGTQHADAVAGRAAAPAPGDPGALEPVRRGVRARRAVGRPASGRHRSAADGAGAAEGVGQLAVRRRTRARRDPPRRLDRRRRAGRRRAGRPRAVQRPAGGPEPRRGFADPALPVRQRQAAAARTARAGGLAAPRRRHPQQPARARTSTSRSAC